MVRSKEPGAAAGRGRPRGCCGQTGRAATTPTDNHGGRMVYEILDVPPWPTAVVLGLQQYLTMLGSTVLCPTIVVPSMGGSSEDLAVVICTIFFASGIITLLQTFIGDRLPVIQGGSFAYIAPVLAIAAQIKARGTFESDHARFLVTMREVQGGIIGSGLIVFLIGATGIIRPVLRAIGPITVAANIGVLGLALANVGFPGVITCPQIGFLPIFWIVLFSQYLRGVAIKLPGRLGRLRLFELFPVLLGLLLGWFIAWLLTIGGAYTNSTAAVQAACGTDQSHVLADSPWVRFPFPFQFGVPTMSWAGTLTMLAGALPAMVESLGDYYAAADISGAPVPPPGLISRAIAIQGATCVLAGMWGTSSGTTAYNENIGSMLITRVGSRRVVQYGACFAIVMGMFGKFGGLFASLPNALVSGLFCCMFSVIVGVGLSQMRHADQHSNRNIFILGFALYMGLSVSGYFSDYAAKHPGTGGPIATSSHVVNDILNSIFSTAAAVALIITLFLDNTIPGSDEERGLHVWQQTLAQPAAAAAHGKDGEEQREGADDDDGPSGGGAAAGTGDAAAGSGDQGWAAAGSSSKRGARGSSISGSGPATAARKQHWWEDDHLNRVYGLPFNGSRRLHQHLWGPLAAWGRSHITRPLQQRLPAWCCRGGGSSRMHEALPDGPRDVALPEVAATRDAEGPDSNVHAAAGTHPNGAGRPGDGSAQPALEVVIAEPGSSSHSKRAAR